MFLPQSGAKWRRHQTCRRDTGIAAASRARRGLSLSGGHDLRVNDPDLDVRPEDVLILQGAGPVGGPGMPEAGMIPIPKKLLSQGVRDMVRISDARMSGTAYGTVVLHVAPEAAIGGPLAAVRDGDEIELDVLNRRLTLAITEEELSRRLGGIGRRPRSSDDRRGWRWLNAQHVLQADLGCDLDFCRADWSETGGTD